MTAASQQIGLPSKRRRKTDNAKTEPADPSVTSAEKKTLVSPLQEATTAIDNQLMTLHQDNLAPILKHIAIEHLRIRAKLFTKQQQLKKLESDDALIPRSAKLNFTLSVSKGTAETTKFATLKKETVGAGTCSV